MVQKYFSRASSRILKVSCQNENVPLCLVVKQLVKSHHDMVYFLKHNNIKHIALPWE